MGFLSPWFLCGLAALGVPVFVHLLRKHVTLPRPVGSLMFFEHGTQSSIRHRRLRYYLLFALRFALLFLVVLAFADPFARRSAADVNGRLLLVVIDNSFSMKAGTRFADAKQQALALLAAKPHSQKAQVMSLGGQLTLLTPVTIDETQLRAAVDGLRPGDGHAGYGELGHGVRTLAESVHGPIDLHLFSDMQRTAMPGNFADMVLPVNATVVLHPVVKGAPPPNWTIESVEAPGQLNDPKDPGRSRVKAIVAGFNTPAADKSVSLIVNGKALVTHTVKVPANGRATVEFAPLDIAYGLNRCEVRVAGEDAFPEDDASVFAVRRSDPERVLFVHVAGETRSALYFGTALHAATQGAFLLQSVTAEQTTDLDPARFSFVVLSDVESLPALFERALAQYIVKGGNVLLVLGTGAQQRARLPLWDGEVQRTHDYTRDGGPAASVGQVDFTHPALQQAEHGRDNGGWSSAKFAYAAKADPNGARIAARLNDGTPLLLDKPTGEGHVLLFASGFDNLTNDLPLHPVFVAFVDRMARYLSGNEGLSGSRLVDSYVQLRPGGQPVGAMTNVEVTDPKGRRPLSLSEARTAQVLRLDQAGFYGIRLANGRDAVVGVNPDRRESDLDPMPEDVQKLWSGSNVEPSTTEKSVTSSQDAKETKTQRVSLWWWIMLLALVAAVAETALASGYLSTQREEA